MQLLLALMATVCVCVSVFALKSAVVFLFGCVVASLAAAAAVSLLLSVCVACFHYERFPLRSYYNTDFSFLCCALPFRYMYICIRNTFSLRYAATRHTRSRCSRASKAEPSHNRSRSPSHPCRTLKHTFKRARQTTKPYTLAYVRHTRPAIGLVGLHVYEWLG